MALNGKYTSFKTLLEELYADNGYQYELPWVDALMWAEEALGLVGHPRQYQRKVTGHIKDPNLDITNYRAELPADFYKLEQIAVNGQPAEYSGDTFHHLLDGACCGIEGYATLAAYINDSNWGTLVSTTGADGSNVYEAANDDLLNTEGGIMSLDLSGIITGESAAITFDINSNHITLSAKTGKVCIAYLAIPTDEEGLPLIPDDVSYKLAVKKYLTMKLDYIEWRRGSVPSQVFDHSEREWMWYVGQAGNKAKMPSLDGMESIKNTIMRLLPNANAHENFFKSLGKPELRKRH